MGSEKFLKSELPRPGSAIYNLLHDNPEVRKKSLKRWSRMNKFLINPLYRVKILPLLGFGRLFLILKVKGRTTGKIRRTPLEYHRVENVITIVSARGEEASWIKNIRAKPDDIKVVIGFHQFNARISIVKDEIEKSNFMRWYIINHGRSAKMIFGWNPKTDKLDDIDLTKILNSIVIVFVYPIGD